MRPPNKPPPLAILRSAALGFTRSTPSLSSVDLTLHPAASGGHALLGRNGCGKTLLGSALTSDDKSGGFLHGGNIERRDGWTPRSASSVSFESHEALLEEGGSVYHALGMPPGTTPSKAAKFLIVRFGLYQLLYRPVTAISTGEIRKVLLARALASRPSLLVLDNAFDGLDVPSRAALSELISTTLKGFSNLLVQGVDASATAHTQVLLITHRAEEIVDEVSTVSYVGDGGDGGGGGSLITDERGGRTSEELMARAIGIDSTRLQQQRIPPLPSESEVQSLFAGSANAAADGALMVEAVKLRVQRDEATLLRGLDWSVRRGEHWLIAGGNGAGKSTLSKLLARADAVEQGACGDLSVLGMRLGAQPPASAASPAAMPMRSGVGWVSTELHLSVARSARRASDVLNGDRASAAAADLVAQWLGLDADLLERPFNHLSQGEQKLVLLGAALASEPLVLVLDEPMQGLDTTNRSRVLKLVESVCRAGGTTLVYITHHYEEVLPSVTHVMHLSGGDAVFIGPRAAYEESGLLG